MNVQRPAQRAGPRKVRLADYRPPPFLVDRVDLDLDLGATETLVTSTLTLRRAPGTPSDAPLLLDGGDLELVDVAFEGRVLSANEYGLGDDGALVLPASFFGRQYEDTVPTDPYAAFSLRVRTRVYPERNTSYKGLYASNGVLCTQCEAEDFRRITFYPDRPDVLARFTTTLRAARTDFPVLLSNGNLVGNGELGDGRHWARWDDPFPKPSPGICPMSRTPTSPRRDAKSSSASTRRPITSTAVGTRWRRSERRCAGMKKSTGSSTTLTST